MSRAFVKEPDGDNAIEVLPEILISPYPNIVTMRGLKAIEDQVAHLQAQLKDGSCDKYAKAEVERDLRYWIARRASAELAPDQLPIDEIRFGHLVTIQRDSHLQTFRIVGQDEANPQEGLLSYIAPLAHALMGAAVGEMVRFRQQDIEIKAIRN